MRLQLHRLHLRLWRRLGHNHHQHRRFATKYSGKVVIETDNGRSFAVEVETPTLRDVRGYALPRRDLICKVVHILQSPPPSNSSAPSNSFLELSDYLHTLKLNLTPSEASEILKSLKSPMLALKFFQFCSLKVPNFRHNCFTYNRILLILSRSSLPNRFELVQKIIDEMERSGIRGSISTVNILIGFFGGGENDGGFDQLEKCLGLVKKWELKLNCYTYKCLLQAYLRLNDTDKACKVYSEMKRRGYKLDIFAYNMLLDALARDEKV